MKLLREWWLVVGSTESPTEAFISLDGAKTWQEDFGGEIVHVQEVPEYSQSQLDIYK